MGKGSGEVRLKGEKSKDPAMKMEKLNRFENEEVVIAGASRGIGRAVACHLRCKPETYPTV